MTSSYATQTKILFGSRISCSMELVETCGSSTTRVIRRNLEPGVKMIRAPLRFRNQSNLVGLFILIPPEKTPGLEEIILFSLILNGPVNNVFSESSFICVRVLWTNLGKGWNSLTQCEICDYTTKDASLAIFSRLLADILILDAIMACCDIGPTENFRLHYREALFIVLHSPPMVRTIGGDRNASCGASLHKDTWSSFITQFTISW